VCVFGVCGVCDARVCGVCLIHVCVVCDARACGVCHTCVRGVCGACMCVWCVWGAHTTRDKHHTNATRVWGCAGAGQQDHKTARPQVFCHSHPGVMSL